MSRLIRKRIHLCGRSFRVKMTREEGKERDRSFLKFFLEVSPTFASADHVPQVVKLTVGSLKMILQTMSWARENASVLHI